MVKENVLNKMELNPIQELLKPLNVNLRPYIIRKQSKIWTTFWKEMNPNFNLEKTWNKN